jgi:hypothetical protein
MFSVPIPMGTPVPNGDRERIASIDIGIPILERGRPVSEVGIPVTEQHQ